jgi:hypothetical protein
MTRFELATPAPEDGALFSNITTSETKTGFLLIETFRDAKRWTPGSTLGGHFLYVRGNKNFTILPISHTLINAVVFIRTLFPPSAATRYTK